MAWPETASPYERRSIVSGMRVRDGAGTFLGYVTRISGEHLYLRRWFLSRHWGQVPLSRIRHVTRGVVELEGSGAVDVAPRSLHGEIATQTFPLVEPEAAHG
ncbi:hypothetical protein NVS55_36205 [Myxococcus stipitatus]|uniref:hypothetical protein n=1 Tax=Myxococcus stipitatus TaxID=83455 RepID=UPI0031453C4A